MGITAIEAAEIAHRHGLGLPEAASLRHLAETVEEADELAATFAPASDGLAALLAAKVPPRPGPERYDEETQAPSPPLRSGSEPPALALNGDPLERAIHEKLGIPRNRF